MIANQMMTWFDETNGKTTVVHFGKLIYPLNPVNDDICGGSMQTCLPANPNSYEIYTCGRKHKPSAHCLLQRLVTVHSVSHPPV